MTSSLASVLSSLLAQAPTLEEVNAKVDLDSLILLEVFYFFTVVVMWLIRRLHGVRSGRRPRKNIMSTAMKNILTIAVVTPSFYYFGWYICRCFEHGGPAEGHAGPPSSPGSAV